jgi:hypothetical protein
MLSGLRAGTPVYVFNEKEFRVINGKVVSVSNQYPQYNFSALGNPAQNYAAVDLVVDMEGRTATFPKIPLNSSVAEFPDKGLLLSETREGVLNEISAIRNTNQTEIDKLQEREAVVSKCDALMLELNPQLKREKEQSAEIAELKAKIDLLMEKLSSVPDRDQLKH